MQFKTKLEAATAGRIGLCVGLDPVVERMLPRLQQSTTPLYDFCLAVVEETATHCAAFKPNLAFFEAYGASGWQQLADLVKAIPADKLVILDGKRGDIGNTAKAYARALFDNLGGDAATVSPYLGADSLEPFVERPDRGVYVLAVTSNPGGAALQNLDCEGEPFYLHIVRMARQLSREGNVGLVVGATRPETWKSILSEALDMPLLIPGIGEQGGDLAALKNALQDYRGPALVNVSRSILYASSGEDFASAAGDAAGRFREQLVQ